MREPDRQWSLPDMRPWGRSQLIIPPNSANAWMQLAIWELWLGMLVCLTLGFGVLFIITSPSRIVAVSDLTNCYGPPPVTLPCERIMYRGGALEAAFTALCGVMLIGVAAWFLWELWGAVEPKPITDDFLRLLNDSFGRDWRNPVTWPWARVLWAYGFTLVGTTLTACAGVMIWTLVTSSVSAKAPTPNVTTSEGFSLHP
jgi:hypothetical protein